MTEQQRIEITIKDWVGNRVSFEYYNDGSRSKLENPYRLKGRNAKFFKL